MTGAPFKFQSIVHERVQSFLRGTENVALLRGPSGSGKSWIAEHVALSTGYEASRSLLFASGQESWQNAEFAPLRRALVASGRRLGRRAAIPIAEDALQAASKSTLGFSEIAKLLLSLPRRISPASRLLTEADYRLLAEFQDVVADRNWLLVADNIHWWDARSLAFVRMLLVPEVRSQIAVARRAKVLLVLTDGPSGASEHLNRLLVDLAPREITIDVPKGQELSDVLLRFGLSDSRESADALAGISGGHLQILRDLGLYLHNNSNDLNTPTTAALEGEQIDVVRTAVLRRLDSSHKDAAPLAAALASLATIGPTFLEQEAICAIGREPKEAAALVSALIGLCILDRRGSTLQFCHELVQRALYTTPGIDRRAFHSRFAECVQRLSPLDLDARAYHLMLAGDKQRAQELFMLASLQRMREGVADAFEPRAVDGSDPQMVSQGAALAEAIRGWLAEDYQLVAQRLTDTGSLSWERLEAERVYLLTDCWLKSLERADRLRAIDVLEEWVPRLGDEFDIWFRLSATLLVAYVQCKQFDQARQTEKRIAAAIEERRMIDARIEYYRLALYRRSSMLHDPEIVLRRQKDAATFFQPRDGVSRCPAEHVRCAGSLMGTLVNVGDHAVAIQVGEQLARFIEQHGSHLLPPADCALNNLALALFLSSNSQAIEVLRPLVEQSAKSEDRLLIVSNLAVMTAAGGHVDEAEKLLAEADAVIRGMFEPDGYYIYFVRGNLVCVRALRGRCADPVGEWDALLPSLDDSPPGVSSVLKARHGMVRDLLAQGVPTSVEAADRELRARHPQLVGRVWGFYMRFLLLTDLQNWSDG